MLASDWLKTLPANDPTLAPVTAGMRQAREQAVLAAVDAGSFLPIRWAEVAFKEGGHAVVLRVASDVFAIGEPGDAVRVNVTPVTAQLVADRLGARLPTTKVVDLAWKAASVRIGAQTGGHGPDMGSTRRMAEASARIDAALAKAGAPGADGIVATGGKDWVNTNRLLGRPGSGANYGWHDPSVPLELARDHGYVAASDSGIRLWQPLGLAHDCFHVDYSQNLRLIGSKVQVDGEERDFDEVVQDQSLCALLSAEGPLRVRRQPSVPAESKAFPEMPEAPAAGLLRASRGEGPLSIHCRDRGVRPGPVRWVVIHGAAPTDGPNTALQLATKYASSTGTALRSVHYILDRSNVVECVKEEFIAFAVAGANEAGVHIELAGAARRSAEDWATEEATDLIEHVALIVSEVCRTHALPLEFVDAAALRAGKNGITTRAEVAKAWGRAKAQDPGPFFPMARLCELVRG